MSVTREERFLIYLRNHYIGADFEWGDPPRQVLVFQIPRNAQVSADLDDTLERLVVADEEKASLRGETT